MQQRPAHWMDNPNADRVKRVSQLAGRSAIRNRRKQFLAEGPQSALEAIRAHLGMLDLSEPAAMLWPAGKTIAEVYYTERLGISNPEALELLDQLARDVFVAKTSDQVLQAMSDAVVHQNIIVVVNMPAPSRALPTDATLVGGLVRVQDPGNAGTIIRTADAAGADYLIATRQTVDVYNPKTIRSTAGSLFHVPVYTNVDLHTFVTDFPGQIFAADGYGDVRLDQTSTSVLSHPTAWLFGNEARGLNAEEIALADQRVAVPLYGLAESLNVSTAATICLYSSAMAQRHH